MTRRNPTYGRIGHHMIISGGFDDSSSQSLEDTWAFDAVGGTWKELLCPPAPALEGHKSVISGFDMFSFGGHTGPGQYSSRSMSLNTLSLGLNEQTSASQATTQSQSLEPESDSADAESSESSDSDEGVAVVELPDGQVLPLSVLQALLRRRSRTE